MQQHSISNTQTSGRIFSAFNARRFVLILAVGGWVASSGFAAAASNERDADTASRAVSPVRGIDRGPDTVGRHGSDDDRHGAPFNRGGSEFRSIDGRGNNPLHFDMGAAHTQLVRWMSSAYVDGIDQMSAQDVPARLISSAIFDQRRSIANAAGASDFLWQWGQFIDHDIDLTDGMNPPEPAPIPVPAGDPWFDPDGLGNVTMDFNRSLYDTSTAAGTPRQQINEITSWIDGSMVYGSNETRAQALRTLDGTGRLTVSEGDLLMYNTDGLPNAGGDGPDMFLAGDVRANEQVGLTAMHTLFVREHNRLADEIAQDMPALSGDGIYLRARRLVAAQIQAITYNEFLPLLLGPDVMPPYVGYNLSVDGAISNVFSTAAFRLGHSMLSPQLLRLNADGNPSEFGHLALRDGFFAPTRVSEEGGIEPLLRGLAAQVCQSVDAQVIDDVRNFLFGPPGAGGFDLVSLNLQRGRDHGLPSLNDAREAIGLDRHQSFGDMHSDPEVAARLAAAYPTVDDVDLWVGVVTEQHVPGALVGPTARALVSKQFRSLRDGDRFWYERILDAQQSQWVNSTRLSDVIRRNTDISSEIGDDVFIVADPGNQDGDAVADPWDNCLQAPNDDQRDTDNDGYGNACDADLNNDGIVNTVDLGLFRVVFGTADPDADFDGDGVVNVVDLGIFRSNYLSNPGPSGQVF